MQAGLANRAVTGFDADMLDGGQAEPVSTTAHRGILLSLCDYTLIGCAPHQHELHFSQMYGLSRDETHRIFLEDDGLVFHQSE